MDMDWTAVGTQFSLQLAFGVLLALAFVPRAPVGAFFYRLMGTTALVPVMGAIALPVLEDRASWSKPAVLATGLAVLAYPIYSSLAKNRSWTIGAAVALFGIALAVFLGLPPQAAAGAAGPVADAGLGLAGRLLATASILATGAVAGSVGLAMVLGHWYLTVPKLEVSHLRRLNRVTVASMILSLVLVGVSLLAFSGRLQAAATPIFGPWGLFHLGTRVVAGLCMPLLFAWMASDSLRFDNTRSATGILYASTVFVLVGTAMSVSLQTSYGVPL